MRPDPLVQAVEIGRVRDVPRDRGIVNGLGCAGPLRMAAMPLHLVKSRCAAHAEIDASAQVDRHPGHRPETYPPRVMPSGQRHEPYGRSARYLRGSSRVSPVISRSGFPSSGLRLLNFGARLSKHAR